MTTNGTSITEEANPRANILIVDDLPEKLLVFQTVLEDLGQNLVMVHSGSAALREILHREFAVILLDVNMPDIDGLETARMIRQYKRTAHTPIIFITSYADEMQTSRGYSLGAVDYILSPVIPEVLRSKVKVFVQLYEVQRRARILAEERVTLAQAEAARAAAEETTRRSIFLSRASRELGASLDLNAGMHRLVELVVPYLADLAMLYIDMDEAPGVMLVRAANNDLTVPVTHAHPYSTLPPLIVEAFDRALHNGHHVQITVNPNDADMQKTLPGDMQWREDLHSLMIVPLRVVDRPLGVLALANKQGTPAYNPADLATIDELASRAAIAFENARLYRSLQGEIVKSRQAEEMLHDASRRKDEFLAMLSHELRNPLAPIRNAVEVIRRVAPPEPRLTWARDVVDRQVSHLARLVEELLDVSRISQGKISLKKEPIELAQVIAHGVETVKPLIEARGHTLNVSVPSSPIWLQGDFARLAQVMANLLNNAAKYTHDGGQIDMVATVQDGHAVISVRDNGIGIEPTLLPRIFDLFAQGNRSLDRSQGGLGVGLTLVQRLVEQHDGHVTAHSDGEARGAEIKVFLPCMRQHQTAEPMMDAIPKSGDVAGKTRVLVVDDNADAAESVAIYLQLEGHEVATATNGWQALTVAQTFNPAAIVIDIGLPGLSGYDVARKLRENPNNRSQLLIALTGYGQKEDQQQALQAGFDYHFVKPTDPQAINNCIVDRLAVDGALASQKLTRTLSVVERDPIPSIEVGAVAQRTLNS